MRIKFTLLSLFTLLTLLPFWGMSQSYQPNVWVYGTSPFQDSLWAFDTTGGTWSVAQRIGPTLSGSTIDGITGLAYDPCGLQAYAILKVNGVSGRVLATMNLVTGVCTQVGNLGDNFSSITFGSNGQLFGLTGDGASTSETTYTIDKNTGSKTMMTPLGNGADGEVFCYNPFSNKFYHWSGNGTVVFEKFLSATPFTVTGIVGSLGTGEIFGASYIGPNKFLVSSINSDFRYLDTLGNLSAAVFSTPDDIRGHAIPPRFGFSADTVCPNNDTLFVGAASVNNYDVIYVWGDGSTDTVTAGGASHVYTTTGNYTLTILLDNGICAADTFTTKAIRVNNAPAVSIVGNMYLCPGDTATLTGASGGTLQWYMNGTAIAGANTSTYTTATPGTYNMIKTNQNGCFDSSATSFVLSSVPNPVVNLGGPLDDCESVTLDAQNPGARYDWSTGDTTQMITVTTSGTYYVEVADTFGCSALDSAVITILGLPTVTYSEGQPYVCSTVDSLTLSGATPPGGVFSGTGVTGTTFSPIVAGLGQHIITYTFTDANGCENSDTSSITVYICFGIEDGLDEMGIQIFPVPASQYITISGASITAGTRLQLVNMLGQVQKEMVLNQNTTQLDISALPAGIYTIQAYSEGLKGSKKITITK